MNGCWSPSPRISTGSGPENEGMFFGFWAGEILRGLGLYLQVQNNIRWNIWTYRTIKEKCFKI